MAAAKAVSPYVKTRMNAVAVDATPSLLYNNLTTNGDRAAFVHKTRVISFNEAASDGKVEADCASIKAPGVVQVKWVDVGEPLLVLCLGSGIRVYRPSSGSKRLTEAFSDDLCDRLASDAGVAKFCRGVTATGEGELVVGTFAGDLAVYKGAELQEPLLSGHKTAVTCMTSSKRFFASADNGGTIRVWGNDRSPASSFRGDGFPCTSLAIRGDTIIGAFASGHVRMYKSTGTSACVEIAAHARCITAMALHPSLPMFATVGEDTVLNVFTIPEDADEEVQVPFTTTVTDRLLTGVQFSGSRANLLVCAYDSHSVSIWLSQ